jgi:hypothetical protein
MNAITELSERHYLEIAELPISIPTAVTVPQADAPLDEFVHPGAIGLALGGFGIFLAASWIGWAFDYTAMLVGVVTGLGALYFGLFLTLGRSAAAARGEVTHRSFAAFLRGRVQTREGIVSGRDALVQIAFMPILLGLTMLGFAFYWLSIRG